MMRSQISRSSTRIATYSAKRAGQRAARQKLVAEVLERDGWECQADHDQMPGAVCGGQLDVHEVIPRSAWALGYLVASNCVTVSRRCHEWISANPEAAHTLGLHGHSWDRPE